MLRFHRGYFAIAIVLLVVEILIALYVHDRFVRPYIGDVLVVILIYCMVKAFFNTHPVTTALCVLLFSFLIETLQYFRIVHQLGWQHSKLARVIIGTSFAWEDIAAYTVGIGVVIMVEKWLAAKRSSEG